MGDLFSSKQETKQRQSTQVPLNFSQLMDRTISFANEGLDTPFQAYNAPRIAELSANEQAGIAGAGQNAGMYQGLIDMAMVNNAGMQAQGGVPTAGDLSSFMNPYIDYVLNNSLSRLNEQSDTNMTKIGSMAGMSGAFGGSRHGVLEGANLAELLKSSGELSANTYSDAFDKGMGNWFKSQDLRRGGIQDALNIATQGSAYNRGDINTLMSTGLTGRTRDQSVLDFAFSEFMREQQDPFTKAGFATSIMSSYPTNLFTRDTNTTTTQTPSAFSQIAGLGMAAAGLATGNPAALAGLGVGQQSLGMGAPVGGIDITGPAGLSGSQMGNMSFDQIMAAMRGGGMNKGGKVKGYKKGGAVESYEDNYKAKQRFPSILDELINTLPRARTIPMETFVKDLGDLPESRKRYLREQDGVPGIDLLSLFPAFDQLPILAPDTKEEKRARDFTKSLDFYEKKTREDRESLQDRILNSSYGKDQIVEDMLMAAAQNAEAEELKQFEFDEAWAPGTRKELKDIAEPFNNLDVMLDPEILREAYTYAVSAPPSKKKYAKGGRVRKFGSGGFLDSMLGGIGFGFLNNQDKPQSLGPQTQPANAVEALSMGNQNRGWERNNRQQAPAPYQPQQRQPYDWATFFDRQGLDRIPTAQSNVNPNYLNGSQGRPDLSMFMQALQQRVAGNTGGQGGSLPTPPFQQQRFAEGGKVYLKMKPSTRGTKEFNESMGFMPTDSVTDLDVPAEYLLDDERVFRLALQKHESGAKEYDKPNYRARPIDANGKPLSSAFGIGQWILPTWNTLSQKTKGEIPSWTKEQLDKGELPDEATQEKAWNAWSEMLRNRYGNDYVSRFAAHQLGDADFSKVRKASPNTLMRDVVGENIARNVSAKNKTVGQYLSTLDNYIGEARNWEKKRLVDKGFNLTDIVGAEGTDNPLKPVPDIIDGKKKGSKNRSKYLDDLLISEKEKEYATRQNTIDKELRKEIYKNFRKDIEAAQLHRPNNMDVQTPTDLPTRVNKTQKRAFEPLELFMGNDSEYSQYLNLIPFKDLPRVRKPVFSDLTPEEEIAMSLQQGAGFKGGGYVKKYAKGQIVETDPHAMHSTDEDVLYKFNQGAPSFEDWLGGTWDRLKNPPDPFGGGSRGSANTTYTAPGVPSQKELLDGFNEIRNPWSGSGIFGGPPAPDSPEAFNDALETGEPSDVVAQPAQQELGQKEDALSAAFRDMILQEIEARKNRKEPDENKFLGMSVNMPLLKMGLSILANSGYPNSAGEAIGKGVLGTLENEQQKEMQKQERNAAKLKELVNLRYMQAMVESMDPNIKKELARQKAQQDAAERELQHRLKLDEIRQNAEWGMHRDAERIRLQSEVNNPLMEDEGVSID